MLAARARSSTDRTLVSGTNDVGSIPAGRTMYFVMKVDFIFRHKYIAITIIIVVVLVGAFGIRCGLDAAEDRRIDAEAVTLKENLVVEFNQPVRVSDFIENLNGEYVEDFVVDTARVGQNEVEFEYINIKNKKRTSRFNIEVVDTMGPMVYGLDAYWVPVNYEGDLADLMISGDDSDDRPVREIVGAYDLGAPGGYDIEYVVTDESGNRTSHPFRLEVFEPSGGGDSAQAPAETVGLPIGDAISAHKNEHTRIGIDVSMWQGDIDWQKVREAGVEFAFIRVGYQTGFGTDYVLDPYFRANIDGATRVGLPIGVYFYSFANSAEEARKQAEWILEQTEGYELELGVVFDWEEWKNFNRAGMSFFTLGKVLDAFVETVEERGYDGLLYGSKNYLTWFWRDNTHPVWVAQYHDHPTYEKDFRFWQLADTGVVPGISGFVDLDVWYLE